eukprot:COSAG02_NODE_3634_length_6446_cov_3.541201_7_plen_266_part_00
MPGRGGQVPFAGPHFSPLTCSNFGTTPRVDPSHFSHPGAQPLLNQKHCRSVHTLRVTGLLRGCESCRVMPGGHAHNEKLAVRTYRLPVSRTEVPLAVRPRRLGDRRIRAKVLEWNVLWHALGPGRQVAVDGVARGSGHSDCAVGIRCWCSQERGEHRHEGPQPAQHRRHRSPARAAHARAYARRGVLHALAARCTGFLWKSESELRIQCNFNTNCPNPDYTFLFYGEGTSNAIVLDLQCRLTAGIPTILLEQKVLAQPFSKDNST